jgi:hypothetical protein
MISFHGTLASGFIDDYVQEFWQHFVCMAPPPYARYLEDLCHSVSYWHFLVVYLQHQEQLVLIAIIITVSSETIAILHESTSPAFAGVEIVLNSV